MKKSFIFSLLLIAVAMIVTPQVSAFESDKETPVEIKCDVGSELDFGPIDFATDSKDVESIDIASGDCGEWRNTGWGYTDEGHNVVYQERQCNYLSPNGDAYVVTLRRAIYY